MPKEDQKKPNKFIGGDDEAKAIIEAMKRGTDKGKQEKKLNTKKKDDKKR